MRLLRERRGRAMRVVRVEVSEHTLERLVARGLVYASEIQDPAGLAFALGAVLDDLAGDP